MKHQTILLTMGLCALLLTGCGQEAQMKYIGADRAKEIALTSAGFSMGEIEAISTDMDSRNGMDYYSVEFTAGGREFEYDVDAFTGTIIDIQAEGAASEADSQALPQAPAQVPAEQPSQTTAQVPAEQSSQMPNPPSETAANQAPQNVTNQPAQAVAGQAPQQAAGGKNTAGGITEEEAKSIALSHAGLESNQVTFIKSVPEYDDGRRMYEVEFYTADYKEYDYDIDAATGEVISYDYDAEGYMPPAGGSADKTLSEDEVKALVVSQVPGSAVTDIRKFGLDLDDGRMEYEGELVYDGIEYEFEIDAYSGAIRSWEAESIWD